MTLHTVFYCISILIPLSLASNCGTSEQKGSRIPVTGSDTGIEADTAVYYLDVNRPSIQQPVDRGKPGHEVYRFVQIEVTEIANPKKHPLTFDVEYQSKSTARARLGSFSLYPSDNPGKFMVATQGKVQDGGTLILSMVTPDRIDARDTIRVALKRMKLIKG
jgi:hypothetical protein